MRIAAQTKNARSGFVLMFVFALLPVAATLLYVIMSLQTASMEAKVKDRSREDLESLRTGINYILRHEELCSKAFYEEGKSDFYRVLDTTKPLPDVIEIGSIKLGVETLLVKDSMFRSFTVDKITINDRSVLNGGLKRHLHINRTDTPVRVQIRAHALQLKVELSQRLFNNRARKAVLTFDMNGSFSTDSNDPKILHCWTMAAPGFDSCATTAGDSRDTLDGSARAVCETGSTLLTGGGFCLAEVEHGTFLNDQSCCETDVYGFLTLSRAMDPPDSNTWQVKCQESGPTPGEPIPSISMAVCCRNNTIDFPE